MRPTDIQRWEKLGMQRGDPNMLVAQRTFDAAGETEKRMARNFEVSPELLALMCAGLWGHSYTTEFRRRGGQFPDARVGVRMQHELATLLESMEVTK